MVLKIFKRRITLPKIRKLDINDIFKKTVYNREVKMTDSLKHDNPALTKIKKYFNNAVIIYAFAFILFQVFERIIPFVVFINEGTNQILFNIFAIAGFVLVCADMFLERTFFKSKLFIPLLIFYIICCISTVLNIDYGYEENLKTLVWFAIHLNIFYTLSVRIGKEKFLKLLNKLFYAMSAVWTVAILVSLYSFFKMDGSEIVVQNDVVRQGFVDSRLFGVFIDPNHAAIEAFIFILFSVFYFNKKNKWALIPFIFINTIYIILSGSRTVILLCLAVLIFLLALMIYQKIKLKHFNKKIMVVLLLCGFLVFCNDINKQLLTLIPEKIFHSKLTLNSSEVENADPGHILDRDDIDSENISNNRIDIWEGYLKTVPDDLIFGKSPRNAIKIITDMYPENFVSVRQYETHNGYLSVLVCTGVLGLIAVAAFLLKIAYTFFRDINKNSIKDDYIMIFLIVISLLFFTCFFSNLFFINNLSTILFWMFIGYIANYNTQEKCS